MRHRINNVQINILYYIFPAEPPDLLHGLLFITHVVSLSFPSILFSLCVLIDPLPFMWGIYCTPPSTPILYSHNLILMFHETQTLFSAPLKNHSTVTDIAFERVP